MRHYFIQDDGLLPDFCYEALRAAEYANWRDPGSVFVHRTRNPGLIGPLCPGTPIGSVEFVEQFARTRGVLGMPAKPLNVPGALVDTELVGRPIWKGVTAATVPAALPAQVFAKSAARYKGFVDIVDRASLPEALAAHGPLDLSAVVDFGDEWRAFVHAGQLVGLHCYSGLFSAVPSTSFIEKAISAISSGLPKLRSYTIDIGFVGDTEAIVEVHPFVACGLYGFRDYRILLSMFDHGYGWLLGR